MKGKEAKLYKKYNRFLVSAGFPPKTAAKFLAIVRQLAGVRDGPRWPAFRKIAKLIVSGFDVATSRRVRDGMSALLQCLDIEIAEAEERDGIVMGRKAREEQARLFARKCRHNPYITREDYLRGRGAAK